MHNTLNPQDLVDIRDVQVDKDLSKQDRVAEFVRQIKDPYHFRCGKFVVTARSPRTSHAGRMLQRINRQNG